MTKPEDREPLSAKDDNTHVGLSKIPQSASKLRTPSSFKKLGVSSVKPPPMAELPDKKRPAVQAMLPASKRARLDPVVTVDDSFTGRIPSKPCSAALSGRPSTIASRALSGRNIGSASTMGRPSSVTTRSSSSALNRVGAAPVKRLQPKSDPVKTDNNAAPNSGAAKRPAWDLKGRLQDLEQILYGKSSKLKENTEQLSHLSERKDELESSLASLTQINTDLDSKVRDLEKALRQTEDDFQQTKRRLERDIEDLGADKARAERHSQALDGELKAAMTEVAGLKSTVAEMSASHAGIQSQYEAIKIQLDASHEFGRQKVSESDALGKLLAEKEEIAEALNSKCRAHETERRRLHNTIQELKGNIRVFCRVRPFIASELSGGAGGAGDSPYHIQFTDDDNKTIELDSLVCSKLNDSRHVFKFDHVFRPNTKQEDVFEEISQLVQSALDGYNVCIFAYGQTGSGKTFTMEGPLEPDTETEGMIPRAVRQIFLSAQQLNENGWKYDFEASFLEIYNETIRDLLGDGDTKVKHEIKMTNSKTNELMVTNHTLVTVTSPKQVSLLLMRASENRAVAETKMNERSSRSHSVFTLKLRGHNSVTTETCEGTLNLVDLAGSERLKDSGSQGARLKETQAINSSLSNLGNVIMALANKDPHIPYRNSKLTYLLQNSLGGNSKTLMFVNVSPREEHLSETINSLRFAAKVNSCNIGTAQKKVK